MNSNDTGSFCYEDSSPEYWEDYNEFQLVKHQLVKRYLEGWIPILSSWNGRVLYIDTHAGRGSHDSGQEGSPIVALKALLNHRLKDRITAQCEVKFFFIEADERNAKALNLKISKMKIPETVAKIQVIHYDCFAVLQNWLEKLHEDRQRPAPAFVFIDPYGFKIPGRLLQELMAYPSVELFVNLMWREIDMHSQQRDEKPGCARNLDELFCGSEWREAIAGGDQQDRAHRAAEILRKMLKAKWCTEFYMLRGPRAIRYFLVHFSNHDAGRKLMKDCMWAVAPENGYFMRKGEGAFDELPLFRGPPSKMIEDWLRKRLGRRSVRWQDLIEDTLGELWRDTHLNDVIRRMRADGRLKATDYDGACVPAHNPRLRLIIKK